ncbi:MAG: PTS sugar transporter subunit IIA [Tissierellia bacterium]|nr:PTS sugar transporter subunit IIA [Tissierellia bacterium]
MIGILIVTHGNFGLELLKSAELIIGKQENVETLSLNHGDDVEELYNNVKKSIKKLDKGEGVLVFTDLFGGSPSTATAINMKDLQFESISGVNLPMLIEALDSRNNYNLEDLVDKVIQIGIDGIKNIRNELTEKSNGI